MLKLFIKDRFNLSVDLKEMVLWVWLVKEIGFIKTFVKKIDKEMRESHCFAFYSF